MRPVDPRENAKDILLRFCRGTSLRGIPRIVSAESRGFQGLWLVFVASLVIACTLNLQQIISLYLEFDVVQMPSHVNRPDAQFPSITVCNQAPLSLEGRRQIFHEGWRTPRQFWSALKQAIARLRRTPNFTESQSQLIKNYAAGFFSLNSYFSNIPTGFKASELGLKRRQLIRKCFLTVWHQLGTDDPPISSPLCDVAGTWRRVHDQNRLNCYSFSVNITEPVVEMELLLFLGHELDIGCDDCMSMDPNTQIMGARVVLHERGSLPDVTKQGFNVYPGTLTEVRFTTTNWTRLPSPYGECQHQVPGPLRIYGHDFAYSIDACKELHHQEYIEQECGCTLNSMPHVNENESTVCERLDNDIDSFTERGLLKAADKTRCAMLASFRQVDYHCPLPCNYLTYEVSTTQAMWPRDSMQLTVFEHELRPMMNPAGGNGSAERHLTNQSTKSLSSADRAEQTIRKMYAEIEAASLKGRARATRLVIDKKLVSRSLLTLRISRKNFIVTQIVDKPVRTLASTLSQIGGLLSMWIGLTLVWLVEVLELCIKLVAYFYRAGKQRPLTASSDGRRFSDDHHGVTQPMRDRTGPTRDAVAVVGDGTSCCDGSIA